MEEVFTKIFESRTWLAGESISGPGSEVSHAGKMAGEIEMVVRDYSIGSMLDLPCGDAKWIRKVDFGNCRYIGADIVSELIENIRKECESKMEFIQLDLTQDDLPLVDLIMVRDCFVHFSYSDIYSALNNIRRAGIKYILTTIFTEHQLNYDIVTGDWRPLNLEAKPFHFPAPLRIILEPKFSGFESEHKGKSLALWQVDQLSQNDFSY